MPDVTTLSDLSATPHATVFDGPPRTVRLALDGEAHDLAAGDLLRFHGDHEVEPEAVEDATALVTFAPACG